MGKVMVEKFLRDIPSIKKVYILVRTKRGGEFLRVYFLSFHKICLTKE